MMIIAKNNNRNGNGVGGGGGQSSSPPSTSELDTNIKHQLSPRRPPETILQKRHRSSNKAKTKSFNEDDKDNNNCQTSSTIITLKNNMNIMVNGSSVNDDDNKIEIDCQQEYYNVNQHYQQQETFSNYQNPNKYIEHEFYNNTNNNETTICTDPTELMTISTESPKSSPSSSELSSISLKESSTPSISCSTTTTPTPIKKEPYRLQIVWRNVFLMLYLHIGASYGVYLFWFYAKYQTILLHYFLIIFCGLGITVGAHRLWAHRSYEASLTLRIILMILNSASLQNDIYEWCRDHRVHHKFSETDADPHNSRRGFFFAHVGWLLCRKHPDVLEKGKTVSMTDLEQDPVVRFQRQFYKPLAIFFTFLVPSWFAYYCWNEDYYTAFFMTMARYTISLHATWLVNSAAHLYGTRPYDTLIQPRESKLVEYFSLGEGYHNYHHVFPYDYSASEMSWTHTLNVSTWVIDCCEWMGLAWNLKKVDPATIMQRARRTGDIAMVEVYREQKKFHSRWRHTLLPIFAVLIGIVAVPWTWRKIASYVYFSYTGVPDKWV